MVGSRAGSDIGYRRIVGVALLRRVIFFIRKVIPFELDEVLIAVSFNRLTVLFRPFIESFWKRETSTSHLSKTFNPCQMASTQVAVYPSLNGTGMSPWG